MCFELTCGGVAYVFLSSPVGVSLMCSELTYADIAVGISLACFELTSGGVAFVFLAQLWGPACMFWAYLWGCRLRVLSCGGAAYVF